LPATAQTLEEIVERSVSGLALEDAVEQGGQIDGLFRRRRELVAFQASVEPPDHAPRDFEGVALALVGRQQLVDKALGVHPTQGVLADAELPGVVGDDDGAREQAFSLERAPKRGFAGDANGIGLDPHLGQA
jgi:hypothetical protein